MPKPKTDTKSKIAAIGNKHTMPVIDSDEPSWTLEEGLSFSGLDLWLRCREQFRLSYIQGWRPIEQQDSALLFGSMIHKLLEDRPAVPEEVGHSQEILKSLQKVYGQLSDRPVLEAKAAAVYRVYAEHHNIYAENRIESGAEKAFHYEYKFRHAGTSYTIPLMGYIDCVYHASKKGAIGIRETKTRSQMDLENTTVALVADLQVNSYFLACEQSLGKFPTELTYDLVKKPAHEPLSANTKRSAESLPEFHNRVFDAVRSDPQTYLQRISYKRSLGEFNRWRTDTLHPHLADFCEWYKRVSDAGWRRIDAYNPTALSNKYGLSRLFHLVVSGDTRGLTKKQRRRDGKETNTQEVVTRRISSKRTH